MNKIEQTFKPIFGSACARLPPVFQKRYRDRPYSTADKELINNDTYRVTMTSHALLGTMYRCRENFTFKRTSS